MKKVHTGTITSVYLNYGSINYQHSSNKDQHELLQASLLSSLFMFYYGSRKILAVAADDLIVMFAEINGETDFAENGQLNDHRHGTWITRY